MDCVFIEIMETGQRRKIEHPVWITKNRNGILRTPHRFKALGVGDGDRIWSLGGLEGYPQARVITLLAYLEARTEHDREPVKLTEEG